jgi:hypothetical protein
MHERCGGQESLSTALGLWPFMIVLNVRSGNGLSSLERVQHHEVPYEGIYAHHMDSDQVSTLASGRHHRGETRIVCEGVAASFTVGNEPSVLAFVKRHALEDMTEVPTEHCLWVGLSTLNISLSLRK